MVFMISLKVIDILDIERYMYMVEVVVLDMCR